MNAIGFPEGCPVGWIVLEMLLLLLLLLLLVLIYWREVSQLVHLATIWIAVKDCCDRHHCYHCWRHPYPHVHLPAVEHFHHYSPSLDTLQNYSRPHTQLLLYPYHWFVPFVSSKDVTQLITTTYLLVFQGLYSISLTTHCDQSEIDEVVEKFLSVSALPSLIVASIAVGKQ